MFDENQVKSLEVVCGIFCIKVAVFEQKHIFVGMSSRPECTNRGNENIDFFSRIFVEK